MYDEHIQQANEDLSKLAMDKAARRQYELREKAARDYKSNISASHEKGRTEASMEHAKKMLIKGFDDELIKEITGLTQVELDAIKS